MKNIHDSKISFFSLRVEKMYHNNQTNLFSHESVVNSNSQGDSLYIILLSRQIRLLSLVKSIQSRDPLNFGQCSFMWL